MIIGLSTIDIHIPLSSSLKEKRRILNPLKIKIRSKFNVSISEVGFNDLWQRSLLAVTAVGNERRMVNSLLTSVVKEIQKEMRIEILDYKMEIRL